MSRTEDTEHTLVFVDMLGFAALTEKFPTRLIDTSNEQFKGTSTSPASNQFNRFNRILEVSVQRQSLYGRVRAMLFSDCAFLEFENSLLASLTATELIRDFILEKVPVRMGIGRGTFYPFKFSTDITDSTIVTRSLFVGTAVVRAHAAERCGGKGLRIFVHPSVTPELAVVRQRIKTIALVTSFKDAQWELDFLYEPRPAQEKPAPEEADQDLFEAVQEMKDETMPTKAKRHYIETIKAMNRMRKENNRPPIISHGRRSRQSSR
jgi:hypothetical protein